MILHSPIPRRRRPLRRPRPLPSIEVTQAELEEIAAVWGTQIETPGNRRGWAYSTANGMRFRAWLPTPSEGRVA